MRFLERLDLAKRSTAGAEPFLQRSSSRDGWSRKGHQALAAEQSAFSDRRD